MSTLVALILAKLFCCYNINFIPMGCGSYDLWWTPTPGATHYEVIRNDYRYPDPGQGIPIYTGIYHKIDFSVPRSGSWLIQMRACAGTAPACTNASYWEAVGVARYGYDMCHLDEEQV